MHTLVPKIWVWYCEANIIRLSSRVYVMLYMSNAGKNQSPYADVCHRRPSMRSTAAALSTDGAASEAATTSAYTRPNTAPLSIPATPLARSPTNLTLHSPSLGKTLGRTTTAAFDPAFFGKTLGRTETSLTAAMFSKTLGRTSTNVVSYGKTLGRSGTLMSGMTMGRTLGREHGFGETMRHNFGATQAAAPPLAIDPLLTAMMQKAGTDVPQSKPRATSPAFEVRSVS